MTNYRLDFYNTSGALQAILTGNTSSDSSSQKAGFAGLSYTKGVNIPGFLIFTLRGDHEILDSIGDKWQVEVWRQPSGEAWYRDFVGIYRQPEWRYDENGRPLFIGYCPGLMSILGWRHVLYSANMDNYSSWTSTAPETIMNNLVDYNACANATTGNKRIRDGAITGLTVEADGAHGTAIDWYCAYDNLLDTLQDIARIADGDFDVVKTSATAWQYRFYEGQLGTDRSATVRFSMELGNMTGVQYRITRLNEKTVVVVGGQGEEEARTTATVTGTNYNASTNNIESFLNATDVATSDGLTDRGEKYLDEVEAREVFTFTGLESPETRYGIDYFVGDLVTGVNPITDKEYTAKVMQAVVSFDDSNKENIETLIETQ